MKDAGGPSGAMPSSFDSPPSSATGITRTSCSLSLRWRSARPMPAQSVPPVPQAATRTSMRPSEVVPDLARRRQLVRLGVVGIVDLVRANGAQLTRHGLGDVDVVLLGRAARESPRRARAPPPACPAMSRAARRRSTDSRAPPPPSPARRRCSPPRPRRCVPPGAQQSPRFLGHERYQDGAPGDPS